jgi:hypothetical protein
MSNPQKLGDAYSAIHIPLDQLPYTEAMDRLVESVSNASGTAKTSREVWRELVDLRKRGLLPRVGRAKASGL